MDERNQDFKNLGLIFSSRWDMTMTDIILHNNSADKDVLLKKDKTQQLIRSCCVIVCLSGSGRHFSQTAPVSRSYRCFPNHQAALQSVNYRLRALSKMRSALREVWLRNSRLSVCGLAQTQPPDMLRLTLCLTSIKSEERAESREGGLRKPSVEMLFQQYPLSVSKQSSCHQVSWPRLPARSGFTPLTAAVKRPSPHAKVYGRGVFFCVVCGSLHTAHWLSRGFVSSSDVYCTYCTHTVHAYTQPNHTARSQGVCLTFNTAQM